MVRQLLAMGVDADVKGGIGFTPLTAATLHGDIRIVRMLLQNGHHS